MMTRHGEQFSCNSSQVNAAEPRLAGQHIFIDRLRYPLGGKGVEVMRDILRDSISRAVC
jgi:hypothetical protein